LRWFKRHNWTYNWQRRFGSERLRDHFIRHWQYLDADNDSNALTDASEGNDAQAVEKLAFKLTVEDSYVPRGQDVVDFYRAAWNADAVLR